MDCGSSRDARGREARRESGRAGAAGKDGVCFDGSGGCRMYVGLVGGGVWAFEAVDEIPGILRASRCSFFVDTYDSMDIVARNNYLYEKKGLHGLCVASSFVRGYCQHSRVEKMMLSNGFSSHSSIDNFVTTGPHQKRHGKRELERQ
jgi:hypothetical protein